jgi:hypothetical protein
MLGAEVETTPATNAVAVSDAPEALTLIVRPPAVAEADTVLPEFRSTNESLIRTLTCPLLMMSPCTTRSPENEALVPTSGPVSVPPARGSAASAVA